MCVSPKPPKQFIRPLSSITSTQELPNLNARHHQQYILKATETDRSFTRFSEGFYREWLELKIVTNKNRPMFTYPLPPIWSTISELVVVFFPIHINPANAVLVNGLAWWSARQSILPALHLISGQCVILAIVCPQLGGKGEKNL